MRKQRLREVKQLAQGDPIRCWQRLDLDPSWPGSKADEESGGANGFGVLAINTSFSVDPCEHLNSLYEVLHVACRAIQRLNPQPQPPGSHHTHPEICWASRGKSMVGQPLWSQAFWLQVFSLLFQDSFPLGRNTQMHVLWPSQFPNFRLLGVTLHQGTDCSSLVRS